MSDRMLLIISLAISFAVTTAVGPLVIRLLKKENAGQSIREEGPESHKSKAGTPTMGAFMFLIGIVVSCIAVSIPLNHGLSADMSILLISHDLNMVARHADQVVLLNKAVVTSGTPEEVFADKRTRQIFGLLTGESQEETQGGNA